MKYKHFLKVTLFIVLEIIAIVTVYLLSAYILSRTPVPAEAATTEDVDVFMITNGVHTDVVMPIKTGQINWDDEIKFINTRSRDTAYNYVAIG